MLSYLLLLSYFCLAFSFEPPCYSCKFYIPHKTTPDLGLCRMFRDYINVNNKDSLVNNFAVHCRNNENLCGKSGFLYENNNIEKQNENNNIEKQNENQYEELQNHYEELQNTCCGEVNEKDDIEELEKLEKDFFEIFQKIKKHNKKRFYKTTKDLYKLFKQN
jgi:hypothetical protein